MRISVTILNGSEFRVVSVPRLRMSFDQNVSHVIGTDIWTVDSRSVCTKSVGQPCHNPRLVQRDPELNLEIKSKAMLMLSFQLKKQRLIAN